MPVKGIQRRIEEDLPSTSRHKDFDQIRARAEPRQHIGCTFPRRRVIIPVGFSQSLSQDQPEPPFPPRIEITVFMMSTSPPSFLPPIPALPSPLRPNCKAQDRLFEWKGVNSSPPSNLNNPCTHDRRESKEPGRSLCFPKRWSLLPSCRGL